MDTEWTLRRLSFYPLGCEWARMGGHPVSLSEVFAKKVLEMQVSLTSESKNRCVFVGFVRQVKNLRLGLTKGCLARWEMAEPEPKILFLPLFRAQ